MDSVLQRIGVFVVATVVGVAIIGLGRGIGLSLEYIGGGASMFTWLALTGQLK